MSNGDVRPPPARSTDETAAVYGAAAIRYEGVQVSGLDGVALLEQVVKRIEGGHPAAATLTAFYSDAGRRAQVALATESRMPEIQALLVRLGAVEGMAGKAKELGTHLRREAKGLRVIDGPTGAQQDDRPELRVAIDWPDYPEGIVVPMGWSIRPDGIYYYKDGVPMHAGPVMVMTRKLVDVDTGDWQVELARYDRKWRREVFPRAQALDARGMVAIGSRGFPVSSANSRHMVAWLHALDQQDAMPVDWSSCRMGWVGKDDGYYLLGTRLIAKGEPDHRIDLHATPGGAQFAGAIRQGGTWQGWLDAVAGVGAFPHAWLAIYAACCAPLVRLLDAPNFGVDFAARSGSGKTTVAELAVSCYAEPRPGVGYHSWGSSQAGTEGIVAVSCDLPICLDEGSLVEPHKYSEAGALLFRIVNGSGRSKGTTERMGLQRVEQWRTVLISTSETGITSWSPHEGTRARVVVVRGHPLGSDGAALSEALRVGIHTNFGHLMPRLVQYLLDLDDEQRAEMRAAYRRMIERLAGTAKTPLARRSAQYVATIAIAAAILHDDLDVPMPACPDVIGWIWDRVREIAGEGDRAKAALATAWRWAWANEAAFAGRTKVAPYTGWAGVWLDGEEANLCFLPERLNDILSKAGYAATDSVIAEWKERGWLKFSPGRNTFSVRIPGSKDSAPKMITLLAASRDDAEGVKRKE